VTVGERPHVGLVELREVGDEAVVEEVHVIDAACGDQLLQQRQFDAVNARIGHRSFTSGVKENGRAIKAPYCPPPSRPQSYKRNAASGKLGGVRVRRLTQKSEAGIRPADLRGPTPASDF
jgi:hypothetical protein